MGRKKEHAVAPVLRVAPLGELKVYTITEDELEALGRGSPGSVYLNLGLALVPVAVAFVVTIASTDIPTVGGKIFFISGSILFFLVGGICLFLARYHHVSTTKLVEKIKNRMPPPEPIPQAADAAPGDDPDPV